MCPLCCRKLFFICRSTVLIFETSTVLSRRCKTAEFKRILVCRLHAILCTELGNFRMYVKRWWNIPFNSVQMCCTSLLDFNTCLFWPFRSLFVWTSARRIFIVLQPVLRAIYIFCLQISIRYQCGQILSTLSQLHIELLILKYITLKY